MLIQTEFKAFTPIPSLQLRLRLQELGETTSLLWQQKPLVIIRAEAAQSTLRTAFVVCRKVELAL